MSAAKKTTSASTAPAQFPTSPDLAHSIGIDCAQEWIDRAPDDTSPPASATAWRARCYADAVHEYEDRPDFLQLLAAWESGFDSTLHGAAIASYRGKQEPTHKPFSWLVGDAKDDQGARFAALTMDICQGVGTCLELVHTSSLDSDDGPTLGQHDTDRLLRMAVASMRLLSDSAESSIEHMNKRAGIKSNAPEGAS
jgi:hypothetical protein